MLPAGNIGWVIVVWSKRCKKWLTEEICSSSSWRSIESIILGAPEALGAIGPQSSNYITYDGTEIHYRNNWTWMGNPSKKPSLVPLLPFPSGPFPSLRHSFLHSSICTRISCTVLQGHSIIIIRRLWPSQQILVWNFIRQEMELLKMSSPAYRP